jgi:tetratricopeptide (TPR) repeat protein
MTRFNRLEFESAKALQTDAAQELRQRAKVETSDFDEGHWLRVALEERREGMYENALRYYSRALELDKSLIPGWVGQVRMLIALGEYPEAALWSGKALELFRNNAELLAARAQALCRTGDLKSAQASCDAAIGQQGTFSYPWIARGELMLARKDPVHEYCFDKAIQLDPDWLVPLEIGDVYLHYRHAAKALTRIRQALERAPDRAHCWYRQGACELDLGLSAKRALNELTTTRRPLRRFLRRLFRRA